ncbi:hypothetical protein HS088_TW22G00270 [Tripterygium wilfordii]|uniref:VTT domain-containing protein n=1 Tax=Tripterygium wilfordii TaxID=458696 RepID=A0A7J7BXF7_TRIWF|nr:hypothetical protein HS088_TW22G00270 [Tripterygium wilfordii]
MAVLTHALSFNTPKLTPRTFNSRPLLKHAGSLHVNHSVFTGKLNSALFRSTIFSFRIKAFRNENSGNHETAKPEENAEETVDEDQGSRKERNVSMGSSFLFKLAVAVGVAVTATAISVGFKGPNVGSLSGVQFLAEGSFSSVVAAVPVGFTFKAFGYTIVLPEYTPGWVYFWLLMAAACGLFISEEALNIWVCALFWYFCFADSSACFFFFFSCIIQVGITLARMLSLDGTWHSFVDSLSRNASYIISTVFWVYWGVCISDMIPYYLGRVFRRSGASDDVCSKLGIGEEKVLSITRAVEKYGNLMGVVERFSLGVRNPTAFLAGALGISPECFFAGVCCGGLITLPLQLGIGFLLRERPVFALATVATVVGIWTVFPYAVAATTALFFYLRRRHST